MGLLLMGGVYWSHGESTESLWSGVNCRAAFGATMSRNQFHALLATICFDDRETRGSRRKEATGDVDKYAPICELWGLWVSRLPNAFHLGEDLCVDEQLVAFCGRCSFRQYMQSKPAKYGLKRWLLYDVATSFVLTIQPYLGKLTKDTPPEKGQGKRVVLGLVEGLSGGNTITTDNFFTSMGLWAALLEKMLALVGTIRVHKQEVPPVLKKVRPP